MTNNAGVVSTCNAQEPGIDPKAANERDLNQLQGEWQVVYSSLRALAGGEEIDEKKAREMGLKLVFDKEGARFYKEGKPATISHPITLDATSTPKRIDMHIPPVGRADLGIYELKGDTLHLRYSLNARPTSLDGPLRVRGETEWIMVREKGPK